ncbi:hypothetical protein [Streptomyces sp. WAC 01529]|uniref:hypothetical protein n=1 Tax=Streptomyces sp. WAC 01529 TaxID=2203205 RepID=UPI0013DEFFB1|nr:hypothetical protein [Streptomyces sp. WAC 01529]
MENAATTVECDLRPALVTVVILVVVVLAANISTQVAPLVAMAITAIAGGVGRRMSN